MPRATSDDLAPAQTGADVQKREVPSQPAAVSNGKPAGQKLPERTGGAGLVLGASWFILGCVAGAAALVLAFWDRLSAMIS